MISETVFKSYKEAVERLEKETEELKKQIEAEQQKTNFAIKELEKNKLEMLVLKKENEALDSIRLCEKRAIEAWNRRVE